MKNIIRIILLAIFSFSFQGLSVASFVNVRNPSFETPTLAEGETSINANAWGLHPSSIYASTYISNLMEGTSLISPTATDGDNIAVIKSRGNIFQKLDATLEANTIYTLTLDVGKYNGYEIPWCDHPGAGTYFNGFSGIYFGYDQVYNWSFGVLGAKKLNIIPFADGEFTEVEIVFKTGDTHDGIGKNLWISLYANGADFNTYVAFDNVRMDAVSVPLPETFLLLGSGILFFCGIKRRHCNLA